ncbi:Uncharacterized protein HZ326_3772 [Fusarium oxysporum f. sp. albedinis]|nr:Uncharacterized protein HZ326_3772 [Fusarium oxysporum f. sp. albedinis]
MPISGVFGADVHERVWFAYSWKGHEEPRLGRFPCQMHFDAWLVDANLYCGTVCCCSDGTKGQPGAWTRVAVCIDN